MRASAISQYSFFNSIPIAFMPSCLAAQSVDPDPANGSNNVGVPGGANRVIM